MKSCLTSPFLGRGFYLGMYEINTNLKSLEDNFEKFVTESLKSQVLQF